MLPICLEYLGSSETFNQDMSGWDMAMLLICQECLVVGYQIALSIKI